jgi:3D (Asp-Asp-Asp) domain-containing protein
MAIETLAKLNLIHSKLANKLIIGLIIVFVFDFFLFAAPALAGGITDEEFAQLYAEQLISENIPLAGGQLPESEAWDTVRTKYFAITAYNSEVAQTDDTPCITANNFDLCQHGIEDSVATNVLKFGTKIRIPAYFGDRVFVVRDRMNSRYTNRLDIWMIEKSSAKKFGLKYALIEILEP